MIPYDENNYLNYLKTEVKYPHKKPFLFLKEKEEDSIYKFMVRDEKGKYFIQLWNQELPNKDEIKKYLNDHKPLTKKQIEEKKLEKLKEQEKKLTLKNLYYKNREKYLAAYNRNQKFKEKFEERVPLNSVKYCLYQSFRYKHYCHISNISQSEKEIFKIICKRNPGIPFKNIAKEEYDNCKEFIINERKEHFFHSDELFDSNIVENYFTKNINIISEFSNIRKNFLNLYKENVLIWKDKRDLIKEKNSKWNIHHIRPRSMFGCNDDINLVKVTLEEHRVLHSILTLIYPRSSYMRKAFSYMLFGENQKVSDCIFRSENAQNILANIIVYKAINDKIIKYNKNILKEIQIELCYHLSLIQYIIILLYELLKEEEMDNFNNLNIKELEEIYESLKNIAPSILKKNYYNVLNRDVNKIFEGCIDWNKKTIKDNMIDKFIFLQRYL